MMTVSGITSRHTYVYIHVEGSAFFGVFVLLFIMLYYVQDFTICSGKKSSKCFVRAWRSCFQELFFAPHL